PRAETPRAEPPRAASLPADKAERRPAGRAERRPAGREQAWAARFPAVARGRAVAREAEAPGRGWLAWRAWPRPPVAARRRGRPVTAWRFRASTLQAPCDSTSSRSRRRTMRTIRTAWFSHGTVAPAPPPRSRET